MSPEVYEANHRHGPASDYFALGITLHELVCGRRPFDSNRLQAFRFSNDDPLRPVFVEKTNFVSESCKDIIVALLNPKASRRLGSTRGFDEIIRHKWLGSIDWEILSWGVLSPPYLPDVSKVKNDFKNDIVGIETLRRLQSAQCPQENEHQKFKGYCYSKLQTTIMYNSLTAKANSFITPSIKSPIGNLSVYIETNTHKIKAMNDGGNNTEGKSSNDSPQEKQIKDMRYHQISSSSMVLSSSEMDDDSGLSGEFHRRVFL